MPRKILLTINLDALKAVEDDPEDFARTLAAFARELRRGRKSDFPISFGVGEYPNAASIVEIGKKTVLLTRDVGEVRVIMRTSADNRDYSNEYILEQFARQEGYDLEQKAWKKQRTS